MSPESILNEAISKPSPADREAFLQNACGNDAKLRSEIEALLRAHDAGGSFMKQPAFEQTAAIPAQTDPPRQHRETFDQIGPYKLREKLGEGGMGTVYVADQKEPVQRRVALKLIKAGSDSRALMARFDQERQALAMMDHPNIAKVLDAGVVGRTPYFVMELIKGVPITKYCDEARLTPRERLELFIPVCHAVQHAHQKGIIHRDLKPSNILIGLYDGKPVPKIIDFGVAKATGSRLTDQSVYTEVGALIGTLEYMSPEQAELNNLDIDTRADIYALGIILYELLTGSVPFSQKDFAQAGMVKMLMMIKEAEPPKPSTRLSTSGALPSIAATRKMEPKKLTSLIRGDLDWIIMKSLEKERNRRYETANALAADINRYLNNELVLAARPSVSYRLRKLIQRHRLAAIATLIVATTILATALIQTWSLLRAIDAEKRATTENEAKTLALKQAVEERQAKETALKNVELESAAKDAALLRSDGLRLAAEATLIRTSSPGLSLLLAKEAVRRHPSHLTYDALFGAAAECREIKAIKLLNHEARLLRLSPDKTRFLTAGASNASNDMTRGAIIIWDLATLKQLVTWQGNCMVLRYVEWSPDGRKIAAVSAGHMTLEFNDGKAPKNVRFTNRVVHVIDALTGKDLCRLIGHQEGITTLCFSPDSTRILTAADDRTARVWDAQTGKLLHTLNTGETQLSQALFSPDGKRILTVQSNRVMHKNTYTSSPNMPEAVDDPASFTRKGRAYSSTNSGSSGWSISNMRNPIARLWDAETGKELVTFKKKVDSFLISVLNSGAIAGSPERAWFTPDSKQVIIAFRQFQAGTSGDKTFLCYWDVAQSGFESKAIPIGISSVVAFRPGFQQVATGSAKGVVDYYSIEPDVLFQHHEGGHDIASSDFITSLKFSPQGDRLLVESSENHNDVLYGRQMHVMDPVTHKNLIHLRGHVSLVDADFHPDGKSIISIGGGTLRLWSLEPVPPIALQIPTLPPSRPQPKSIFSSIAGSSYYRTFAPGRRVKAITFSPDGQNLLVGNDDDTACLWNIHTGQHLATTSAPLGGQISNVAFHPQGNEVSFSVDHSAWWIAKRFNNTTKSDPSALFTWNWTTGPEVKFLKGQNFGIRHFQWSRDRSRILIVSNGVSITEDGGSTSRSGNEHVDQRGGSEVSVYDARTGIRLTLLTHAAERDSLPQFCDNDKAILLAPQSEHWIGWFDAASGKLLRKFEAKGLLMSSWMHAVVTDDGQTLMARRQYYDSPICFWNARTGEFLGESVKVSSYAGPLFKLSPDGRYLAVPARDEIHIFEVAARKLSKTLLRHEADVTCLCFSPDSRFLLTGSEDKSAVLWNLETGKMVHVYKGHPEVVMNVAFSPTGTHIATQSTDPVIRVWPVDLMPLFEKRLEREFTGAETRRYQLPDVR